MAAGAGTEGGGHLTDSIAATATKTSDRSRAGDEQLVPRRRVYDTPMAYTGWNKLMTSPNGCGCGCSCGYSLMYLSGAEQRRTAMTAG